MESQSRALPSPIPFILRAEALAALIAAIMFYARGDAGWLLFVLLFLVPDLSMLGYLAGAEKGAVVYNAVHSYVLPLLLGIVCVWLSAPLGVAIATIWFAHIAFDRMLGYGLKYRTGFKDTHLGRIGR